MCFIFGNLTKKTMREGVRIRGEVVDENQGSFLASNETLFTFNFSNWGLLLKVGRVEGLGSKGSLCFE